MTKDDKANFIAGVCQWIADNHPELDDALFALAELVANFVVFQTDDSEARRHDVRAVAETALKLLDMIEAGDTDMVKPIDVPRQQ
jgi:hypothetical protein